MSDYQRGLSEGYRAGEGERIALATANSDLRSDLLLCRQLLTEEYKAEWDKFEGVTE